MCHMFDLFSKTVSRNFVRNLERAEGNRDKYFAEESAGHIFDCYTMKAIIRENGD